MKQSEDNKTIDLEDLIVWPDDTWCYRYELYDFKHKSDDYKVLYFETDEYFDYLQNTLN